MTNISTGKSGEDVAERYLRDLGWKIIERNFKKPWGEIDIIAKDPANTLVFVEVKTMRQSELLTPEDNMSRAKITKVRRTASMYAGYSKALDEEAGWRIDLIAITIPNNSKEIPRENIRHYENVL